MARPGKIAIRGARLVKFSAVSSMLPRRAAGGCWPRPRKESGASAMIAPAIARVAWTRSGAAMLGST
jgi:hypothetical protein